MATTIIITTREVTLQSNRICILEKDANLNDSLNRVVVALASVDGELLMRCIIMRNIEGHHIIDVVLTAIFVWVLIISLVWDRSSAMNDKDPAFISVILNEHTVLITVRTHTAIAVVIDVWRHLHHNNEAIPAKLNIK
jgi:xanthine/uracil/vitamin C permease (AzgA family)